MSLLDFFLSHLIPHDCLDCGAEGGLLCGNCSLKLKKASERCYRCHRSSLMSLTCSVCRAVSDLHQVRISTIYSGAAKMLVWKLKSDGAQTAATVMATHMKPLLSYAKNSWIVPVPTATTRVRQRGYDQAHLLARELSRLTGLPVVQCLIRSGQAHQVGAGREQRLRQLAAAFRVRRPHLVQGAHILLVDDVVTTGATLEAAAKTLQAAGAAQIDAVIFAQPLMKDLAVHRQDWTGTEMTKPGL